MPNYQHCQALLEAAPGPETLLERVCRSDTVAGDIEDVLGTLYTLVNGQESAVGYPPQRFLYFLAVECRVGGASSIVPNSRCLVWQALY